MKITNTNLNKGDIFYFKDLNFEDTGGKNLSDLLELSGK